MSWMLVKFIFRVMFMFVGGVLVINFVFVQDVLMLVFSVQLQVQLSLMQLDIVQVIGICNSFSQVMDIKCDLVGVVDVISVEDIGKFFDINLVELFQCIIGIFIECCDGEGVQVMVCGFGLQFNMVMFNGCQMFGVDVFGVVGQVVIGGVDGGICVFNFVQFVVEVINGIEVYKISQVNVFSGGIGVIINILMLCLFDYEGVVVSVGVKVVFDRSQLFDNDLILELLGIFSYISFDRIFGVGVSVSYQKCKGGLVQVIDNYWNIQLWIGMMFGNLMVVNVLVIGVLYVWLNDLCYVFFEFECECINGQVVLQFVLIDVIMLIFDYMYLINEIIENCGEQGMWLQNSNYIDVMFDISGVVVMLIYICEIVGIKDFGFEQQCSMQKYKLGLLGLNVVWNVIDWFKFSFDVYDLKNESCLNDLLIGGGFIFSSIVGINNCIIGLYCGGFWVQEMVFNNGLLVGMQVWYFSMADVIVKINGVVNLGFVLGEIGLQVLCINLQIQVSEIKQGCVDGEWSFDKGCFQFGVDLSKQIIYCIQVVENYNILGDWGVVNVDGDVVNGLMDLLQLVNIVGLFKDYSVNSFIVWCGDVGWIVQWVVDNYGVSLGVSLQFVVDNWVEEKIWLVYFQVELDGDLGGLCISMWLGVCYEIIDVVLILIIVILEVIEWQLNNDFCVLLFDEQ